ncbi:MAG: DUF6231 family protein [Gammaproteobacteria bacterium]|mgnify:FL=1|nr:MAG: hypothetical protein CBD94_04695 [Gammaproteobacteria bacterium TMED234]|tara:strand:+ start:6891 stop:7352 length:462 start_codon:yes stop_codon:yes gene_type:complete
MIKKEKILFSFISNIIDDEKPNSIKILTSQNISKLIKRIEKTKTKNLSISPKINNVNTENCDLYLVLDDIKTTEADIGIIKNLYSQKIVVFSDFNEDKKIDEMMLKLGLQTELRDKTNKLKCFSYNLKTYNNKRSWNNSKGWANPENFDKFRW